MTERARIKYLKTVLKMDDAGKLKHFSDYLFASYLFVDEPFGILTRPALELVMAHCKRNSDATLYIIDFKDIHRLNAQIGYNEVNIIISRCIADFTYKFKDGSAGGLIVGRVFSGDEIAIIDDTHHDNLMTEFADICKEFKLGFRWVDTKIKLGLSLKTHRKQVNDLSQKLQTSLYSRML